MNRPFIALSLFSFAALGLAAACSSSEGSSSSSSSGGAPSSSTSSGGASSGGSSTSASSSGGSSGSSGAALAACGVTKIEPVPGEPSCTECMADKCCAELKACDRDELCLYCMDHKLDDPERCVDPSNFTLYAPNRAIADCQTDRCVPPCGAKGSTKCGPGANCKPGCPGYPSCP